METQDAAAPAVSVLMPVHDAERWVAEAIESILAQTFGDFEFLIYDDGSTDRSADIAQRYAQGDPRIRLARRAHAGLVTWLVEGVARARGEFLARMDADDVARPERLALQVDYLRRRPDCAAVGAEALLVDPEGRPIRKLGVQLSWAGIDAELMRGRGDALLHPTALFRRSDLVEAGGYRTEYETAEDLDLLLRLSERREIANLPEVLLEYRQHFNKVSVSRVAEQRRTQNAILREACHRRGLPLPEALLAPVEAREVPAPLYWRNWARDAIESRHLGTARRYAWAYCRAKPLSWRAGQLLLRALLGLRIDGWKHRWRRLRRPAAALGPLTPR